MADEHGLVDRMILFDLWINFTNLWLLFALRDVDLDSDDLGCIGGCELDSDDFGCIGGCELDIVV